MRNITYNKNGTKIEKCDHFPKYACLDGASNPSARSTLALVSGCDALSGNKREAGSKLANSIKKCLEHDNVFSIVHRKCVYRLGNTKTSLSTNGACGTELDAMKLATERATMMRNHLRSMEMISKKSYNFAL